MSPVTAPDAKARSQRFLAPLASLVAFIVLNYWVGYRLFKRFQIITPKWTNV